MAAVARRRGQIECFDALSVGRGEAQQSRPESRCIVPPWLLSASAVAARIAASAVFSGQSGIFFHPGGPPPYSIHLHAGVVISSAPPIGAGQGRHHCAWHFAQGDPAR